MSEQTDDKTVVEAKNLEKTFRDFWYRSKVKAVNDISFNIKRGEVFGLLGPNGSGKSTTLKILLGLLYQSNGEVNVFGKSPRNVGVKARIGYLPEESYLYKYLTARESLDFFGQLFDLSRSERRKRTEQLIDMVGLRAAADRPVGEFSKGMARRTGIGQALINDPDLIILDEPTSGLDPIGCRQVKDIIIALARRGKTVLLASHLLADVEDVCDRVAILYQGKIRAHGEVKQLLEQREEYRLSVGELSKESLAEVMAVIRDRTGRKPDVDHPHLELEQFFIDVVKKAKEEAGEITDDSAKSPIADYLAG